MAERERLWIIKVGGSLYDLPDLGGQLRDWLASQVPSGTAALLVPGGGAAANVVRDLDARHGLGEETAHWLALRALTLNAHFLAYLLPGSVVLEGALFPGVRCATPGWDRQPLRGSVSGLHSSTPKGLPIPAGGRAAHPREPAHPQDVFILDPHSFLLADERRTGAAQLPHTWNATSDSIAARAAVVLQAERLVLLKSATIPPNLNWDEASGLGLVDPIFPQILRQAGVPLEVVAVNLRSP